MNAAVVNPRNVHRGPDRLRVTRPLSKSNAGRDNGHDGSCGGEHRPPRAPFRGERDRLGRRNVDGGPGQMQQVAGFVLGEHQLLLTMFWSAASACSARAVRDLTVPAGRSSTAAVSRSERSA